MINYSLLCRNGHGFDGWFRNSEAFEEQKIRGLVTCPVCGQSDIDKGLMAPALSHQDAAATPTFLEAIRSLRQKILKEADDVGTRFAEEARKIHYEESARRAIYGTASKEDVTSLLEEGIPLLPVPVLPEDQN